MNHRQEIANAVSMLLPAAVILYYALETKHTLVWILVVGTMMHLPVSFTYHLSAACCRYPDRIDHDMRRLDQSLQHVACIIFAFATSGSIFYAVATWKFNFYFIYKLWDPKTTNDGKRFIPINIAVHFYLLPLLWRGDYENFLIAFESFWMGGVFFVPWINAEYFGGWGHCVFHAALAIHSYALAASAQKLVN